MSYYIFLPSRTHRKTMKIKLYNSKKDLFVPLRETRIVLFSPLFYVCFGTNWSGLRLKFNFSPTKPRLSCAPGYGTYGYLFFAWYTPPPRPCSAPAWQFSALPHILASFSLTHSMPLCLQMVSCTRPRSRTLRAASRLSTERKFERNALIWINWMVRSSCQW